MVPGTQKSRPSSTMREFLRMFTHASYKRSGKWQAGAMGHLRGSTR
jgi:hypothetical protein